MNTTKYKIWDRENNKWFQPTYPKMKQTRLEEIMFSQAGDLFLHKKEADGEETFTFIPELTRFEVCRYTGRKDEKDQKTYENDIIKTDIGIGRVIYSSACFMIEWLDDPQANMELLSMEYKSGRPRKFERLGNCIETPSLLKEYGNADTHK